MFEQIKSQDLSIQAICNIYKTLDEEFILKESIKALDSIYKDNELDCVEKLRPLTPDEAHVFMYDYILTEYKRTLAEQFAGLDNLLNTKNGTIFSLIDEVGSVLMGRFLPLLTIAGCTKAGFDKGVPLITHKDGHLWLGLFLPTGQKEVRKMVDEAIASSPLSFSSKYFN